MLPLLFGKNKSAVTVIIGSEGTEKVGKPEYDKGEMKKVAARELITAIKDGNVEGVASAFEAMMLLCEELEDGEG